MVKGDIEGHTCVRGERWRVCRVRRGKMGARDRDRERPERQEREREKRETERENRSS